MQVEAWLGMARSTLFIRMLLGRWADLRTTTLDYDVYSGQGYDVDFDMA